MLPSIAVALSTVLPFLFFAAVKNLAVGYDVQKLILDAAKRPDHPMRFHYLFSIARWVRENADLCI
jgi:hypothetical protein